MGTYTIDPGIVIFDIDGTLSNRDHRLHFILTKNYDSFHDAMEGDSVITEIRGICNSYFLNGWDIYLFTGRDEKYREITERWLKNKGIFYHHLIMRKDRTVSNVDTKRKMYEEIGRPVHIAFDDMDKVCAMWASLGIRTCKVL